jgi:hypothetical protein
LVLDRALYAGKTDIAALEDAEDYKAFEAAITADYDAQSAVERDLVLRLSAFCRSTHAVAAAKRFIAEQPVV